MPSTSDVLDHHLQCFTTCDINAILADYSPDAVFFGPDGVARGPNGVRPIFQKLFDEFGKPGSTFTMKRKLIEGEYAFITWTSETADNVYELASDAFVIQDGTIRLQAFMAKVRPKPTSRI